MTTINIKRLIEWHRDRANELDAHASELLIKAEDGHSSKHTRKRNTFVAGLERGMASRHRETVIALEAAYATHTT